MTADDIHKRNDERSQSARARLPPSDVEFRRIQEHHPLLSSTGCTAQFCQAGRMIHTDEERLGRDRPTAQVEGQALDFLAQLRWDDVITSDEALDERRKGCARSDPRQRRRGQGLVPVSRPAFAILGSGDSTYGDSFNGGALKVQSVLRGLGCLELLPFHQADTSRECQPWRQLEDWWGSLKGEILRLVAHTTAPDNWMRLPMEANAVAVPDVKAVGDYDENPDGLVQATIISVYPPETSRIKHLLLDLGKTSYPDLCHIDVFVPSPVAFGYGERPRKLSSASSLPFHAGQHRIGRGNKLELVVQTRPGGVLSDRFLKQAKEGDQLKIRVHPGPAESLATDSSPLIAFATGSGIAPLRSLLQARAVRVRGGLAASGRLSLKEADIADSWERPWADHQLSMAPPNPGQIHLFIGCRPTVQKIVSDTVHLATCTGLSDRTMAFLTPRNEGKIRAQDSMLDVNTAARIRRMVRDEGAKVFACGRQEATDDFAAILAGVVGVNDIRAALRERLIEEVFEWTGGRVQAA